MESRRPHNFLACGGTLYRRTEYSGLSGTLVVRPDGTYTWNANTPVSGRWRRATKSEMDINHQGGAGVVLLQAKSGWDWVVMKNYQDGQNGEDIAIRYMGMREFGSRGR
jgi:hypothetical protein